MTFQEFYLISRYFLDAIGWKTEKATIIDKSLGTLLHFWSVFQFAQAQPLSSPHKQRWTRVSRIFPSSNFVQGKGSGGREGELQENFEKDARFYGGKQKLQKIMNTALLSRWLLSMIVTVSQLATSKGDLESRLRQTANKIQIQMTLLILQHRGFRISSQVLKLQ